MPPKATMREKLTKKLLERKQQASVKEKAKIDTEALSLTGAPQQNATPPNSKAVEKRLKKAVKNGGAVTKIKAAAELGDIYHCKAINEPAKAMDYRQEAFVYYQIAATEQPHAPGHPGALWMLGVYYKDNYIDAKARSELAEAKKTPIEKAEELFEKALEKGDAVTKIKAATKLGDIYHDKANNEPAKAMDYRSKAFAYYRIAATEQPSAPAHPGALWMLGIYYKNDYIDAKTRSELVEAKKTQLEKAEELFEKVLEKGDAVAKIKAVAGLGDIYHDKANNEPAKAMDYRSKAFAYYQIAVTEQPHAPGHPGALWMLGVYYKDNYIDAKARSELAEAKKTPIKKAEELFEKALEEGDATIKIKAAAELGDIYNDKANNEPAKAMDYRSKAFAYYRIAATEQPHAPAYPGALWMLGVYYSKNDYIDAKARSELAEAKKTPIEKAEELFEKALEEGDAVTKIKAATGLGDIYHDKANNEPAKAMDYRSKAFAYYQIAATEQPHAPGRPGALWMLGVYYKNDYIDAKARSELVEAKKTRLEKAEELFEKALEKGDAVTKIKAAAELGDIYNDKANNEPTKAMDYRPKAFAYYRIAATEQPPAPAYPGALWMLGTYYIHNYIDAKARSELAEAKKTPIEKAEELFEKALEEGDATIKIKAAAGLGDIYHDKANNEPAKAMDYRSKAFAYYRAATEQLHAPAYPGALWMLGMYYKNDYIDAKARSELAEAKKTRLEKAEELFEKALEKGDATTKKNAAAGLGDIYHDKANNEPAKAMDYRSKAFAYYQIAATEQPHAPAHPGALWRLGVYYIHGYGGAEPNFEIAEKLLNAVLQENKDDSLKATVTTTLGELYEEKAYQANNNQQERFDCEQKAFHYYRKAANEDPEEKVAQPDFWAQYKLGVYYLYKNEHGENKPDFAEAKRLLTTAPLKGLSAREIVITAALKDLEFHKNLPRVADAKNATTATSFSQPVRQTLQNALEAEVVFRRDDKAITLYDRILQSDPKRIDARFYKACAHERKQEFAEALAEYGTLLGKKPHDRYFRYKPHLGKELYNSNFRYDPYFHFRAVCVLVQLGEEAEKECEEGLERSRSQPTHHMNFFQLLGFILHKKGKKDAEIDQELAKFAINEDERALLNLAAVEVKSSSQGTKVEYKKTDSAAFFKPVANYNKQLSAIEGSDEELTVGKR